MTYLPTSYTEWQDDFVGKQVIITFPGGAYIGGEFLGVMPWFHGGLWAIRCPDGCVQHVAGRNVATIAELRP